MSYNLVFFSASLLTYDVFHKNTLVLFLFAQVKSSGILGLIDIPPDQRAQGSLFRCHQVNQVSLLGPPPTPALIAQS